ncbi:MAG TPA: choice-of-anchor P family protein [Bryobacteraceae bacterium]|nr:choice-of-anchor P family protein [Bryobacteraceae bacterium]
MPSRFRFKGSAYGAAGVIRTPFQEIIHTQASANLADFGGYGSGRSEDFAHRDILRFDLAKTEVTGSETHPGDTGKTYSTLVKATVEGLDIMGMITADRVVANMVSTYNESVHPEPSVRLIGSRFENLRIAGIPVKVCLNLDVLDGCHRHEGLKEGFRKDKKVRDLFGDDDLKKRHAKAPPEVKNFLDAPPKDESEMPHCNEITTLSIVRKLEPECNAFETFGHVIHIEGFGTIRLGEVRICRLTRRLSMIQVRLGCPVEGDGSVGVVDDGGSSN